MNNIRPFRFWCQKVLPLVYDDSLSYYELLCKLVSKVNEVIKNENDLTDEWKLLKEWANNYIKETVDSKLDQMAAEGRLNKIGNGNFDMNLIDAFKVWYPNGYNGETTLITNSHTKNLNKGEFADIVLQDVVNYTDTDPLPNENFTKTTGLLYTADFQGYTLNTEEATTQNFGGIQSIVKNSFGGLIGVSALQGRYYTGNEDDTPNILNHGGNKGVAVGGGTFTSILKDYGGYSYGSEFDCYDRVSKGTFPTYTPGDTIYDKNSPRVTAAQVLSVGGITQPATAALITNGADVNGDGKITGGWYGIYIGGTTCVMEGQNGYKGTVGLMLGGWTEAGHYGHTAIRLGYAVRHIWARDGMKNVSNSTWFMPSTSDNDLRFCLVRNSGKSATLEFVSGIDVENDEKMTNSHTEALIRYSESSNFLSIESDANIRFLTYKQAEATQGYVMSPNAFRPTWNGAPDLGNENNPFGMCYCNNLTIRGSVLTKELIDKLISL